MRYLIILLSFIFVTQSAEAQNNEQTISINGSAEVLVPADQISFQINLNAEADTPKEAYDLHKKREQVLVQALEKHNISEKDINFEPISINKTYDNQYSRDKKEHIKTNQRVMLSLDDFEIYEEIQITLIENGFDQFSGQFMSSKSDAGEDEALRKALKLTREKADIIAEETGLTITGIANINYSFSQRPPQPMMEMRAKASDSLMEFDQTVGVSANVSVTYNFEQQ